MHFATCPLRVVVIAIAALLFLLALSLGALRFDRQQPFDFTQHQTISSATGALIVTARIPPVGATSVPPSANIVLVFDRPMVPLSQVQNATVQKTKWPVTIRPMIKGQWRWLGTTAVRFVPDVPLPLATMFTVTVPAGIQSISGESTEQDFSWSFETERPMILSTEPSELSEDAGPTTKVILRFNQEMELIGAKESLQLYEKPQTRKSPKTPLSPRDEEAVRRGRRAVPLKIVSYGTKELEDQKTVIDKTALVLSPEKPLSFRSEYALVVAAGIRGTQGQLGSSTASTLIFKTVGAFQVTSALYDLEQLRIEFTNPIKGKTCSGNILLTRSPISVQAITIESWWDRQKVIDFWPTLEPSTDYTLVIRKGCTDVYDQPLEADFVYTWKTPPLPAVTFLHPRGRSFAIFERGKTPIYYVNVMNTKRVDVQMGELPIETFLRLRQVTKSSYDYIDHIDMKKNSKNVRSWNVRTKNVLNKWESIPFDLEKKLGSALRPSLYVLSLTSDDMVPVQRVFAVTNMGITLKYSGSRVLAWITDLQTGDPVADASIEVKTLDGKTAASGKTDKDGFFESSIDITMFVAGQVNVWQPEFWVIARKDDDLAFVGSDWNTGMQPYDFDGIYQDQRNPESAKVRLLSTLYTERPIYRVGDTVFIKGLVRFLDWDGKMAIPSAKSLAMTVNDPNGKEIYKKTLEISAFGSVSGSLLIDKDAPLGYYSIFATVVPEEETGGQSIWGGFEVLAYRKPEYRVSVTPELSEYFNRQTVKAEIIGSYYFGAPMDGARVEWRAITTDYYFNKFTESWYSFAADNAWCWRDCDLSSGIVTEGKGTLDATGKLSIRFPVNIDSKTVSQVMTIEADITDKNNQVVSSRGEIIVHKSKVYVGVRTDDYVVSIGQKARVSLVTLKPDGSPVPNQQVSLALFSRTWNTIKQKGVDSEYYYDNLPVDTLVRTVKVKTDERGKLSTSLLLDAGGQFQVIATVKDSGGLEAKAGTSLYAWSDTYVNWPHSNNDRIEIVLDKPLYKVGDTAKLLVKTPYQGKGVKALVTVERENVITKNVIDVTSNALPIDIPITDDLIPTAYVSVVVFKPRLGETFNEHGLDTGAPAFKIGYVKLPIDTAPRKMSVVIKTDKEKYLPGESVTATLETSDPSGKPVSAELSLGVVDLSLLDLAGFSMPELVWAFYGERGLGVTTANMLTYLMERFKPGSKGGDGGEENRARGTFRDTAFWKANLVTDAAGRATISFKLPDNLTTWHLLALGSTKTHLFGGQAKTILTTKKVILRPVRPRFSVVGDKVELGAIVHNYLEAKQTFVVTLAGSGFLLNGPDKQTVTIEKGGKAKVLFPVTMLQGEQASMRFLASTAGARDEITETIPLFRFGVLQTNALTGSTETTESERVAVPTERDASDGKLSVSIAPSVAIYLASGLEYLAKFPYGCAEQIVSAFLPNVLLKQLQTFDAFRIVDDAILEKNVRSGLQQIYAMQQGDGGFGYWRNSYATYPRLTAYMLYALTLSKNAGYSVDADVVDRARAYLESALHATEQTGDVADPATRAYILYVLSEDGTTDIALLNNMMKQKDLLPIYARAYLAMAFEKARTNAAKKNAKLLLADLVSHAQMDARGAEFQERASANGGISMNTNDRTTAIALEALLRIDPSHPLVPKVMRGLLASRRNGHWDTTQSTASALLSLIAYMRQTNELAYDFRAAVALDGKTMLEHAYGKNAALAPAMKDIPFTALERGKTVHVQFAKEGKGKLYYDLALSYFSTPDVIEPMEEGMGITRDMVPIIKGEKGMQVGKTYKVTLTVTVPQTRYFVGVESPLPAGMEAIDLSLQTSQQGLYQHAVNQSDTVQEWWRSDPFSHKEFRDDRVFLFADELVPGVYTYEYLVRATSSGTFRERPAKAWEMYFPETFGQTKGGWITIGR